MNNTSSSSKIACKICGNVENNTEYVAREMMYGLRESFNYMQCASCDCLQLTDDIDDMSKYYPSDYYSFSMFTGKAFSGFSGWLKKKRYKSTIFNDTLFSRTFTSIAGKKGYDVFSKLKVSKSDRILDVGCGNGEHFLYPLAEIGFMNLEGCDPFIEEDISYDNGLEIKKKDVLNYEGNYELITYHHAFEHLPNPDDHFKKVHELLEDTGVCIIRIPTVPCFAWEHYRTNWVQLDAPRHFFLHSRKSIEILANKNKLELFNVKYDSNHLQFSGSELYLKDIPLKDIRTKKAKEIIKQKKSSYNKKARLLNRENNGDQAAFFLRKKLS